MSDFLEGEFLAEQERCGSGHGEFHFDKELGE